MGIKSKVYIAIILIVSLLTLLAGCGKPDISPAPEATTRTVTDMAGRQVVVPTAIEKVYSTSAVGSVFLYTLAPDKIAGWTSALRGEEKKYVDPKYHNLPDLGRWKGTTPTGSIEDLLRVNPDIIISVGDVSPSYADEADAIQSQTGIPVIMLDGSLKNTAQAYKFLGDVIDESEKAQLLADYCDRTLEGINADLKSLPDENRIRVYYAEGISGLETEISGTLNTEAFDLAGVKNVAVPPTPDIRRMQVSIEQILTWDPDLILISTDGDTTHALYEEILKEKSWTNITAVKNGEVFEIPLGPYDWLNRPPSVVRFIGVKWLSALLYPDVIDTNIHKDITEFYSLFFNYKITETEIDELLAKSLRK